MLRMLRYKEQPKASKLSVVFVIICLAAVCAIGSILVQEDNLLVAGGPTDTTKKTLQNISQEEALLYNTTTVTNSGSNSTSTLPLPWVRVGGEDESTTATTMLKSSDNQTTEPAVTTQFSATSSSVAFQELVDYWGTKPIGVTPLDMELGHSFKTYLYPLSSYFHKDAWEDLMYNMTVDCLFLKECTDGEIQEHWPRSMDHEAEVVILRKFIASLHFVQDPNEADLFIVPALTATATNHRLDGTGCLVYGKCKDAWFEKLNETLHFIDNGKPHLFFGTQDVDFNHQTIKEYVLQKPNCHVISYGAGNPSETLVVPSLDVNPRRQPRNWKGSLSISERSLFVLANFGIRHLERTRIAAQLEQYNGTKVIWAPNNAQVKGGGHFNHTLATPYHGDAIFVLCLPGDRPFTKRMYDTWSSVAIPVVVRIPCEGKVTHWRGCKYREAPFWPSFVDKTYPRIAGLNYSDILIEVERDVTDIMNVLEAIPSSDIDAMLKRIELARHHFVYDFHGTKPDAFSDLLKSIQLLVRDDSSNGNRTAPSST
jgi:hypothetical protein